MECAASGLRRLEDVVGLDADTDGFQMFIDPNACQCVGEESGEDVQDWADAEEKTEEKNVHKV